MSEPKLRLNGQNVRLSIFLGGTPFVQSQIAKSVSIEPRVTEHDDAFLGSDADDPDQQVRGWNVSIDTFYADATLKKAFLDREAKRVARQPFPELSIGFIFENRDGTNEAFVAQKCEGMPSFSVPDAKERVMVSFKCRAKYYKPVTI